MDEPMNYALIRDGKVTNIIWLLPSNKQDFPNAVCIDDLPVMIGDTYFDEVFRRNGVPINNITPTT